MKLGALVIKMTLRSDAYCILEINPYQLCNDIFREYLLIFRFYRQIELNASAKEYRRYPKNTVLMELISENQPFS